MLEIPNLNVAYEDETGTVLIHDIGGEGQMLVVHAEVIPTTNRSVLLHYRDVINAMCEQLKSKGINHVDAWVLTDEQIRFAQFFGFEPTGEEITIMGQTNFTPIYKMVKRIA
jgi:hypothetical protein